MNGDEAWRVFGAWLAAFFLMEPLTSLLILNDGNKTTMLSLMTDFVYGSISFIHAVYVYKHLLKKEDYFPKKVVDLPLFISVYATIQFALDMIWLFMTKRNTKFEYPLQNLFQRYEKVKKISHSVNVITYGLVWVNITYFFYNCLRPLEWISTIIGSFFILLLLHHKDPVKTL